MKQEQSLSGLVLMLIIAVMLIASSLMSCSTRSIAHTPSKREIRKAMSYSTWEYSQPRVSMPRHMESRFKHAVVEVNR
jgi:hypothetical protein